MINPGYEIKPDGTVLALNGKVKRPWVNRAGYVMMQLQNTDGAKQHHLLHRLVAEKFIPNPYNLPQVNHKDGDKLNNAVTNLEWCDQSDNMKHSYEIGLRPKGVTPSNAKLTMEQAEEMRRLREAHGYTYYVLGDMFGVSYQAAHLICKNKYFKGD